LTEVTDFLSIDWDVPRKPYPAKVLTLATGEKMVVREASREEVPKGVQHELGGAKAWVLTKENYYKYKGRQVFGDRPVPEDLYKQSLDFELIEPDIMRLESD